MRFYGLRERNLTEIAKEITLLERKTETYILGRVSTIDVQQSPCLRLGNTTFTLRVLENEGTNLEETKTFLF